MRRARIETIVITAVALILAVSVGWIAMRMQLLRPVDYQEDIRFKSSPTANPPGI